MFTKRLEFIFISTIIIALAILANNYYQSYLFEKNDIPQSYKQQITSKEQKILQNMKKNFGFIFQVPIIVTNKFKGKLYGLTSYEGGHIKIYLNKKVMKESMKYMIDSVIAHEYAHALLFKEGYIESNDDGHSELWKQTCIKLGGKDCRRYVNQHEIIMSKLPFQ